MPLSRSPSLCVAQSPCSFATFLLFHMWKLRLDSQDRTAFRRDLRSINHFYSFSFIIYTLCHFVETLFLYAAIQNVRFCLFFIVNMILTHLFFTTVWDVKSLETARSSIWKERFTEVYSHFSTSIFGCQNSKVRISFHWRKNNPAAVNHFLCQTVRTKANPTCCISNNTEAYAREGDRGWGGGWGVGRGRRRGGGERGKGGICVCSVQLALVSCTTPKKTIWCAFSGLHGFCFVPNAKKMFPSSLSWAYQWSFSPLPLSLSLSLSLSVCLCLFGLLRGRTPAPIFFFFLK